MIQKIEYLVTRKIDCLSNKTIVCSMVGYLILYSVTGFVAFIHGGLFGYAHDLTTLSIVAAMVVASVLLYENSLDPTFDSARRQKHYFAHFALFGYCFTVPVTIYLFWVTGAMEIALQVFADNAGAAVTTVTSVGVLAGFLISSVARYNQAQRYGIPFKLTHGGLSEPVSLMVELLAMVAAGLVAPFVIAVMSIGIALSGILTALFVILGMGSLLNFYASNSRKPKMFKDNRGRVIIFLCCVIAVIAAFTWLSFAEPGVGKVLGINVANFIAYLIIGAYAITILISAPILVVSKLSGEEGKYKATAKISGTHYFIAMRHTSTLWICIPCKLSQKKIKLIPGDMVIKALDKINSIQTSSRKVIPITAAPKPPPVHGRA
ncbi:MAG: hypothetical protein FWC70_07980 [Defluviitaleaceae bacterium]|nr:hypothetical protein [Defluviitaleaceae bacterium]